uniref:Uncharacterized protein n=1 Tax=viral metagenome TaxID=1070528 RepID=A0A6C0E9Y1_9ZZZZ
MLTTGKPHNKYSADALQPPSTVENIPPTKLSFNMSFTSLFDITLFLFIIVP